MQHLVAGKHYKPRKREEILRVKDTKSKKTSYSGITPREAQGTERDAEDLTRVG